MRPFDPAKTALQKYPITEYQPVYFISESFEDAKEKMMYVFLLFQVNAENTDTRFYL